MKPSKRTAIVLAWVGLVSAPFLSGCERRQGPMEKAGEKVDEAVDEVLHPDEGALEKAGRKTDEALDSVKEKLE